MIINVIEAFYSIRKSLFSELMKGFSNISQSLNSIFFICGTITGIASMSVPIYLAECAPTQVVLRVF